MLNKKLATFLVLIVYAGSAAILSINAFAVSEWTVSPVVNNSFDQVNPAISGSVVVWQDYRNKSWSCAAGMYCSPGDIYKVDLNIPGSEEQLNYPLNADDPGALDPDISGSKVVWRSWATGHIRVHDINTDVQQNASTGGGQKTWPAISGNRVVWSDYRNSAAYADIYMRDLTAPADAPVSVWPTPTVDVYKGDKTHPDIDGNIVVWEDMRNAYKDATGWIHNRDIYMKDLSTGLEQPVCTVQGEQYSPVVSGNKVLWHDARGYSKDVYMKDLTTGAETRLTGSTKEESWPDISGDLAVWKDSRSGAEDIYLRRLSTGAEVPLTLDSYSQKLPAISGATVAWMDYRNGNWDIYAARDTVPPAVSSVGPSGWIASTAADITASFSEAGAGLDLTTATASLDGAPLGGCSVSLSGLSCPVSGLAQGGHTVLVSVSDLAGNAATGSSAFTVDTEEPQVSGMQPAPGSVINNAFPAISINYYDSGGIDVSKIRLYVDDIDVTPLASIDSGTTIYTPGARLDDGMRDLRFVLNHGDPNAYEQTWSFTVISPALTLSATSIYWPDYASYLARQLRVDYRIANPGSGLCKEGQVAASYASNGVLPLTDLPINLGNIAVGATLDYSIMYSVPAGVSDFVTTTHARCLDDGSNIHWFAGPPP